MGVSRTGFSSGALMDRELKTGGAAAPRQSVERVINAGARAAGSSLSSAEGASTMRLSPIEFSGLRLMFHGSMVALVTPMNEDGSLDLPALRRLVDFHVENGTDAIVAVGTTGEAPALDRAG